MSGKPRRSVRQFTADEKLKILEEGRQPGTTLSEVLRRYQLDANTFYRWEREAKAAMLDALSRKPRARDSALRELEKEVEQLRSELEKKRRVISEVVEENLALKRGL